MAPTRPVKASVSRSVLAKSPSPSVSSLTGAKVTKPAQRSRSKKAKAPAIAEVELIENKLVDSLRPGLILVMIGLNPGIETARTGM